MASKNKRGRPRLFYRAALRFKQPTVYRVNARRFVPPLIIIIIIILATCFQPTLPIPTQLAIVKL